MGDSVVQSKASAGTGVTLHPANAPAPAPSAQPATHGLKRMAHPAMDRDQQRIGNSLLIVGTAAAVRPLLLTAIAYSPIGTKPALKEFLGMTPKVAMQGATVPEVFKSGLRQGAQLGAAYFVSGKVAEWTGSDLLGIAAGTYVGYKINPKSAFAVSGSFIAALYGN